VRAFVARRAEEPFRLLFRRHTPALLRLGQRLLGGDAAAAEDAVQEAWIRAATRLPDFRFESKLRTWLCGFVVNRCREVLRSRGATAPVTALPVSEPAAAPADTARALDLERAVLSLADGYRAVFVLHTWWASRTARSPSASRSRKGRRRASYSWPGGCCASAWAGGPFERIAMNDEDELTEAERRALDALPTESRVPAGFEDRVVESLRARGLLAAAQPARVRPRRQLLRLGLAASLFGSGLGTGLLAARRAGTAPEPLPGPLYLLLLYPGPRFAAGGVADEAARVAQYGAWAGRLRRAGQLLSAERLEEGARMLVGDAPVASEPGPQGFFLIRALDAAEAEAIARECPHLRHGGRIAVQAVDPT